MQILICLLILIAAFILGWINTGIRVRHQQKEHLRLMIEARDYLKAHGLWDYHT